MPNFRLIVAAAAALYAPVAFAGNIITANLPAGTSIVNIDARNDGAASFNSDQSIWKGPFGNNGLLSLTIPAGTYTFTVTDPADAAARFPGLTPAQQANMYTAWTYNSPWIEDYLVFDGAAATNSALPQIFDGAPGGGSGPSTASASAAYQDAITNGYANELRIGSRASTTIVTQYTTATPETLLFVIPDNGVGDNAGGVSIIVAPLPEPASISLLALGSFALVSRRRPR